MALAKRVPKEDEIKRLSARSFARKTASAILILLAAIGLALLVSVRWLESQVLNTDNWVRFVAPLPQNTVVAEGLTQHITNNVIDQDRLSGRVQEILPEEAEFIAPTLTRRFRDDTKTITRDVVDGREFEAIWISGNQAAHQELMNRVDEQGANMRSQTFQINLDPVRSLVADRLDESAQAALNLEDARPLNITLDLGVSIRQFATLVGLMSRFSVVLPIVVIALAIWGIVLASDRRIGLIGLSAATAVIFLLELIIIKAQRIAILNNVENETFEMAGAVVYDSLVASLNAVVVGWVSFGIIVWILAVLAGPRELGIRLRHQFRIEELLDSDQYHEWQSLRVWISDQKYYIWTVIFMIALFYMAFIIVIDLNVALITAFAVIAAIGMVQLLGTPPYLIRVSRRDKTGRQLRASLR